MPSVNKNDQGSGLRAQGLGNADCEAHMTPAGGASSAPTHVAADLGRPFWRALEEQAGDPAFQERLYNEFPSQIEAITDPVARRTFLKLMGASLALAGV